MLHLVALIIAVAPADEEAPVVDDGDGVVEAEAGETVIRRRRPLPPRTLEVPIRRVCLAVGGASGAALLLVTCGGWTRGQPPRCCR